MQRRGMAGLHEQMAAGGKLPCQGVGVGALQEGVLHCRLRRPCHVWQVQ